MAQSDRFYFWRGYYDALMLLGDDGDRGRFARAMCEWAFEEVEPDLSDSPIMAMAWTLVRDQIHESVELGRAASEAGRRGGRPRKSEQEKGAKRVVKTPPFRGAKRVPERVAERDPERGVESEGKGTERKGSDLPSTSVEGGGLRADADAGATPPVPLGLSTDENGYVVDVSGNVIAPPAQPPVR